MDIQGDKPIEVKVHDVANNNSLPNNESLLIPSSQTIWQLHF